MHFINEQNILVFLVQILLLLGLARGLGEVFRRWKQPAITAEILVGIILGPTVLGRLLPAVYQVIFPPDPSQQDMLETVGWIGVLFLLLETGLEVDFSAAWRQRGDALRIAVADIVVPLAIAFTASMFLPNRYLAQPQHRVAFSLFMATVMAISAMPVAARALYDLNLSKTDLGFLILSAMSVNDIIGWLLFTLVLGFFTQGNPEVGRILIIMVGTIGFAVFCLTVGRHTHFIFLVLAPPYSDAQVQILAHIVRTMQEPQVRERLFQAEGADAIWAVFSQAFAAKRVVRAPKRHRRQRAGASRLGRR